MFVCFIQDYSNRGNKKFGDKCENTTECGFPGSVCDPKVKQCQCSPDLPATNHIDKCGKGKLGNFLYGFWRTPSYFITRTVFQITKKKKNENNFDELWAKSGIDHLLIFSNHSNLFFQINKRLINLPRQIKKVGSPENVVCDWNDR
jgi:hypothetical protein